MGSRTYRAVSRDGNRRRRQTWDRITPDISNPENELGWEVAESTNNPDKSSSSSANNEMVLVPKKGGYFGPLKRSKQATGTNSNRKRRRLWLFWLGGITFILIAITAALITTSPRDVADPPHPLDRKFSIRRNFPPFCWEYQQS